MGTTDEIIVINKCDEIIDNWGHTDTYMGDKLVSLLKTPDEWTDDQRFITDKFLYYFIDDLIVKTVKVGERN
jgi:hypothetical protein